MQKDKIRLTIFTPTYNRAHTLGRTYESLLSQDCKDFIWLIIDDGSTDETKDAVRAWQAADNGFEIRYIYKENGGMHTAHNTAYENIDTELNMCIDSDDAAADCAIGKILRKWDEVRGKGYAGIIGLDASLADGKVIGRGFPKGMTETTLGGYYAAGGKGDKKLVYRTDIINSYPAYPVFEREKYIALAYKYRQIDKDYKLAVLDEVLCLVEYQKDGSTKNMLRQYADNPRGFAEWRVFCLKNPISIKRLLLDSVHYVSSSILSGDSHFIRKSPRKLLTLLAAPAGMAFSRYIKYKTR
ncbi:MAG: glycosyltransferase family 2 protein [Mogibacterium sp.]|nr:glycosyltransferase family 2 protein [Mogibacterium sp.]